MSKLCFAFEEFDIFKKKNDKFPLFLPKSFFIWSNSVKISHNTN